MDIQKLLWTLRLAGLEQTGLCYEIMKEDGKGVVLYLRQEDRGIAFMNKLKAYNLQDKGIDTVEVMRL